VVVLVAVSLVALLGMAGFAIDVATWYQVHRKQQSIADAAAMAAAGDLPLSTGQASLDASSYASKNGGSVNTIGFSKTYLPDDTVTVTAQKVAPAYFLHRLLRRHHQPTRRLTPFLGAEHTIPVAPLL